MKPVVLADLLQELKQVRAVALSSETGEALEAVGEIDAETLCAVTSVSAAQFHQIADVLGAGALERWSLVTERDAYYVSERSTERRRLVAVGDAVKSPEATSKALHKAAR